MKRKQHYFKCEMCDESFLTKSDLSTHVESIHVNCYSCQECTEKFMNVDDLEKHVETLHEKNDEDKSCQTDQLECSLCDVNKRRAMHMDLLEKEHMNLKEEHAQFKRVYFDQSNEITTLKQKIVDIEDEKLKEKLELEKIKRSSIKTEKEQESKIKDIFFCS